jgi:hypothetical protein
MVLFVSLLFAGTVVAKTNFISIGAGGTGGVYYPYGGGVAEIWSKHVKDVKAVAEVTGASVENIKLAHKGETVIGEVMGDVAQAAYNGTDAFKDKKQNILGMAAMYPMSWPLRKAALPILKMSATETSVRAAPAAAPISWQRPC